MDLFYAWARAQARAKKKRKPPARVGKVAQKKTSPAAKQSTPFAPGFVLIGPTRATFTMPIPAAPMSTFEEHGRLGNGYDWASVVRVLVREREPKIARQLRYDPEADTFAVSSKSKPALEKLAALIRLAISDPEILAAAISASEPD